MAAGWRPGPWRSAPHDAPKHARHVGSQSPAVTRSPRPPCCSARMHSSTAPAAVAMQWHARKAAERQRSVADRGLAAPKRQHVAHRLSVAGPGGGTPQCDASPHRVSRPARPTVVEELLRLLKGNLLGLPWQDACVPAARGGAGVPAPVCVPGVPAGSLQRRQPAVSYSSRHTGANSSSLPKAAGLVRVLQAAG